jgi:hypothetical protein
MFIWILKKYVEDERNDVEDGTQIQVVVLSFEKALSGHCFTHHTFTL